MTGILDETPGPGWWVRMCVPKHSELGHRGMTLADMDTLVGTIYQNILRMFMHPMQQFYNIYIMIAAFFSKK